MTQAASEGSLDPLVGRDGEVERVIQILCRRTKNNPVLIGEPGVGKTAIVEGLAQRISDGDVPPFLADKRILSLDLSLIVAGTKYRGQFEERLKTIMKELMESQNSIVFIDELHTLVGAGSAEGSLDAANILKPALSRGEIQCIGATTPGEYRKSVEKDRSLERRFQSVKVPAPNEEEAMQVISGVRERYEKFHAVSYTEEALRYAVYLSNRYIPDRFLPDKAIDLIDEAGARVKLRQASVPEEVSEVQKRVKFITHRMETRDRQPRIREGAFLFRRRAQRKRKAARSEGALQAGRRLHRHRHPRRHRRSGFALDRHRPSLPSKKTNSRSCCASNRNCTSASSARTRPSPRWRARFAAAARDLNHPRVRLAASCSLGPRASAKRKWLADLPNFSLARKNRWCASTCRNSWRSIPFRS